MSVFLERLRAGEILLCDGAMGTALTSLGFKTGYEMVSAALKRPDLIVDIYRQYVAAGADIIQTHTFSASPDRLREFRLESATEPLNIAAVRIARSVALPNTLIAGDIGPSGCFSLSKRYSKPELAQESYQDQISVLADEGVDLILAETLSSPEEARIIVETTRQILPTLPVVLSFHVYGTHQGFKTPLKATIQEIVAALVDSPPDALGFNCGSGIDEYIEAVAELRQLTDLPIICQPNAGIPTARQGEWVWPSSSTYMAERLPHLLDAGATVVGGCCGTTAEHIAAFRRVISMRSDPLSYN